MAAGTSALLQNHVPHRRQGDGEHGRTKFNEIVLCSDTSVPTQREAPLGTDFTRGSAEAVAAALLPSESERETAAQLRAQSLTTAGEGLTTGQFFFFLHNSKLIGGEARNRSNKHGPLLLKRISFSNSF